LKGRPREGSHEHRSGGSVIRVASLRTENGVRAVDMTNDPCKPSRRSAVAAVDSRS